MKTILTHLETLDLKPREYRLLCFIIAEPLKDYPTAADISQHLGINKDTIWTSLRRLQTYGLIKRERIQLGFQGNRNHYTPTEAALGWPK